MYSCTITTKYEQASLCESLHVVSDKHIQAIYSKYVQYHLVVTGRMHTHRHSINSPRGPYTNIISQTNSDTHSLEDLYILPPFAFTPRPLTFKTPALGSNGTLVGFNIIPLGSKAGALLERFDAEAGIGIGDGLDEDPDADVVLPLFCEGEVRLKCGTEWLWVWVLCR